MTPGAGTLADALHLVTPERLVALLQELVAEPTVTGTAAESEGQHRTAARMQAAGLDTDLWALDLAALERTEGFPGTEAPRDEAWGLVGTWGEGEVGMPTVVLDSHLDVVPPGDLAAWTGSPWSGAVRGDRLFGRGACDMKAGLAASLTAVAVLREAGVRLPGKVAVWSVVSEEDGGLGTFATLQRGHTGDLAVVPEPTELALVPACAGALTFRLTVPGLSAHGSVRTTGVDAVEKYLAVHLALRRLEAARNRDPHALMAHYDVPYPLSVGTVRAGDWASSVPDLLVAEGRLGVALGEPVEHARQALEDAVAEVCADDPWLSAHPVQVAWAGGQFASGAVDPDGPLARLVGDAHQHETGARPRTEGASWGSDLRLLTAAGIPTVHYGPGDIRRAHAPDESVPVAELVTATRTLVRLVAQAASDPALRPAASRSTRPSDSVTTAGTLDVTS